MMDAGVFEIGIEQRGPVCFVARTIRLGHRRERILVVGGIHENRHGLLPCAVEARRLVRLFLCAAKRRQQQRSQDSNDHYDDQQFDQGKATPRQTRYPSAEAFVGFKRIKTAAEYLEFSRLRKSNLKT